MTTPVTLPPNPAPRERVPASAVREQLNKLLASDQLVHSERLTKLLHFITEETLAGRERQLKEARLGVDVFRRPDGSYDPAIDPIVRVQMGRLRTKLRHYYEHHGQADTVVIEVPVGGYVPQFRLRRDDPACAAPTEAAETRLAVLPFVNMSRDPDNEYFCDGLTDELINRLAQRGRLRVVARTSSFQFKGVARDIREIGRQLAVDQVLEGSVHKAGQKIRVTVQLINVRDGCHLWSERFVGEVSDVFDIHDRIAGAMEQALHARLAGDHPPVAKARKGSVEAYNHYLQGRFLWKKRTEADMRTGLRHFETAVQLDPGFARAHSGIADCHLMLGMSGAEAPDVCMPQAAASALRALELDGALAEAHASLAAVKNCYEWDFAGAMAGFRRAMALDPSYATTFHWSGVFSHQIAGHYSEAVEDLEHGIELDPLSLPIVADVALAHAIGGQTRLALDYCQRALELDARWHRPYWFRGLAQAWTGEHRAAGVALKKGLELCEGRAFRARLLGALGFNYGRGGRPAEAARVLAEMSAMKNSGYLSLFEVAQVHVGCGDVELALKSLEQAVATRDCYAMFIKVWPSFEPLRPLPRFRRLVEKIGL